MKPRSGRFLRNLESAWFVHPSEPARTQILWVGHNHPPTSDPAKKWAVKDGDFCCLHFYTSPDRNAHRFRTPQSAEQQPFNLPNPESAGKIIYRSSLSRNSHCWERGCKRADQSPKKFPTNKIFLPHIPALGAGVFHPFNYLRPAQLNRFSD